LTLLPKLRLSGDGGDHAHTFWTNLVQTSHHWGKKGKNRTVWANIFMPQGYSASKQHNAMRSYSWFCRAMLYASVAYAVMRCVCVCVYPRVRHVRIHSVKTNKHVFNFFSPLGRHTILVFLYQTA